MMDFSDQWRGFLVGSLKVECVFINNSSLHTDVCTHISTVALIISSELSPFRLHQQSRGFRRLSWKSAAPQRPILTQIHSLIVSW